MQASTPPVGKPRVKLIIFDIDGTLVDSQNLIVETQRRTFLAHGIEPPTRERSLSIVGLSLLEAFTVLVGPEGPAAAMVETYRSTFRAVVADPRFQEPLFPQALETLRALHRRDDVLLGIATGKSRRGVERLLALPGWGGLFSTIQTADDAPSKPHPGMILQAMSETGIAPASTFMIGDSTYDMIMTRAAGATPVGVSWGYHASDDLREAGAVAIVESYAELAPLLDELVRGSDR
jgi:phosphoglycolate phosphatase